MVGSAIGLRYQEVNSEEVSVRQQLEQLHHAHVVAMSVAKRSEQQVSDAQQALRAATKKCSKLAQKCNRAMKKAAERPFQKL